MSRVELITYGIGCGSCVLLGLVLGIFTCYRANDVISSSKRLEPYKIEITKSDTTYYYVSD